MLRKLIRQKNLNCIFLSFDLAGSVRLTLTLFSPSVMGTDERKSITWCANVQKLLCRLLTTEQFKQSAWQRHKKLKVPACTFAAQHATNAMILVKQVSERFIFHPFRVNSRRECKNLFPSEAASKRNSPYYAQVNGFLKMCGSLQRLSKLCCF